MDFFVGGCPINGLNVQIVTLFFIEIVADDEISAIQPVRNNVCYYHTKTNVVLELEFVE
jgi:hypothetical protein